MALRLVDLRPTQACSDVKIVAVESDAVLSNPKLFGSFLSVPPHIKILEH